MKNILPFTALLGFLSFIGCGGDTVTVYYPLAGQWVFENGNVATFSADGAYSSVTSAGVPVRTATWSASGDTLTIDTGTTILSFSYSVSGTTLTLTAFIGNVTTLTRVEEQGYSRGSLITLAEDRQNQT